MKLQVNELFTAIQGEGLQTGQVQTFVRLQGCNLRCRRCDSVYAYTEGEKLEVKEVVERIKKIELNDNVFLTGGEVLIQEKPLLELLKCLKKEQKYVTLQTNGTLIDKVNSELWSFIDFISIDYKTSCTEEKNTNVIWALYKFFTYFKTFYRKSQVKFVCLNRQDVKDAIEVIEKLNDLQNKPVYIFQPMNELISDDYNDKFIKELLNTTKNLFEQFKKQSSELFKNNDIRFLPQLHVLLWGNRRKV